MNVAAPWTTFSHVTLGAGAAGVLWFIIFIRFEGKWPLFWTYNPNRSLLNVFEWALNNINEVFNTGQNTNTAMKPCLPFKVFGLSKEIISCFLLCTGVTLYFVIVWVLFGFVGCASTQTLIHSLFGKGFSVAVYFVGWKTDVDGCARTIVLWCNGRPSNQDSLLFAMVQNLLTDCLPTSAKVVFSSHGLYQLLELAF